MNGKALELEALMTHAGWLRRFAVALVCDEDLGADLSQSALIAAWKQSPERDRDVRPWLAHVVRRRFQDHVRSEGRRQTREAEAAPPTTEVPSPEDLVGQVALHRTIAEIVTGLEEPFRQTLVLRFYEALTAAEISRRLRVPAGTVRWRLKEGLTRVRRELDARHGGERRAWVLALAPLVPPQRAIRPITVASVAAGLVGTVVLGAVLWSGRGRPGDVASGAAVARGRAEMAAGSSQTRLRAPAGPPRLTILPPSQAPARPRTDPRAETIVRQMLGAIADGSYDDLLLHAGDVFKAMLTKAMFEEATATLGPALRPTFRLEPLGTIRREEHELSLFKIAGAAGADDHLVGMALQGLEVVAFWVQ